jgi:ubiquinone/menaquinone biosynthesis C-methylase UbiE
MAEDEHHGHGHGERRFGGRVEMLRSPERAALLQLDRVVPMSLAKLATGSVVDVGVGSGLFAEAFAQAGLRVSGVDANPAMVQVAREHVPQGCFVQALAEALPYPDQCCDLVFLGHVLHETDRPLAALTEARRVSRVRVAVLEWPYREEEDGPPLRHRIEPERVLALGREAGFVTREYLQLTHMDYYRLEA